MKTITAIKIDIIDNEPASVRIVYTEDGAPSQVILNSKNFSNFDLTVAMSALVEALDSVDQAVAESGDVAAITSSLGKAVSQNKLTLVQAARQRAAERNLNAALAHKRQLVKMLDCKLQERNCVLEIADKTAVLANLTAAVSDHQDALSIVDKKAELERLEVSVAEAKIALKDAATVVAE